MSKTGCYNRGKVKISDVIGNKYINNEWIDGKKGWKLNVFFKSMADN